MRSVPPALFKYEPLSLQSLQNLKRQSLYFGSPRSFNDPFDCVLTPRIKAITDVEANAIVARAINDPQASEHIKRSILSAHPASICRQIIKTTRDMVYDQCDDFNNSHGVTCFSECNDNMLLWSHYGGQHRGFCLEFNTDCQPFEKLHKVTYSRVMPEIDPANILINDDFEQVLRLFCTKSDDWSYEREWRVIHKAAGTVFTYEAKALKSIYFGAKMADQDMEMLCLILRGQNEDVKFYRGHRSDTEFKIEFTPFTYTSHIEARRAGLL